MTVKGKNLEEYFLTVFRGMFSTLHSLGTEGTAIQRTYIRASKELFLKKKKNLLKIYITIVLISDILKTPGFIKI